MGKASEYYETDKFAQSLGIFAPFISTPFHRIQIILQTQNEAVKQNLLKQRFEGIAHVFKQTINEKRLFLWRGISSKYCIGIAHLYFQQMLYYKLLPAKRKYDTKGMDIAKKFATGATVAALTHVITLPLEYHFTRIQYPLPYRSTLAATDGYLARLIKAPAESLFTLIPKTLQREGVKGVYRGYGPSLLASVVYRSLYLPLFDISLPYLPYQSLMGISLYGFLLTTVCGAAAYPIDTVRRRMFVTQLGGGAKYASGRDAFMQITKSEGFLSLYRGFTMYAISNFFAAYLVFAIFMVQIRTLSQRLPSNDDQQ